jgi:hypothetical protein
MANSAQKNINQFDSDWKINGSKFVVIPTKITPLRSDLSADTSGRDLSGTMHIDYIAQKDKFSLSFRRMSGSEMASLLNQIETTAGYSKIITLTYPDPI